MEATDTTSALSSNFADALCARHGVPPDVVARLRADAREYWVHETAPAIFRKPTRAEFKRFIEKSQKDGKKADSIEELARCCVVYPESVSSIDQLFDRFPGCMPDIVAEIVTVSSGKPEEASKKL